MRNVRVAAWMSIAAFVACGSNTKGETEEPEKARESAGRGGAARGAAGSGVNVVIPEFTGMLPALPDVSTVFMCDPEIENATSCGDTTCAELVPYMKDTCYVNCCTSDGRCGTRNTDPRFASILGECTALATPDSRCPTVMVGPAAFAGCCDATNHCSAAAGPYCSSALIGMLGMPARECDAEPEPSEDAGM